MARTPRLSSFASVSTWARTAMARAIGLSDGSVLEEFEIPHTREGFGDFFSRIEAQARSHGFPVAVAMEG